MMIILHHFNDGDNLRGLAFRAGPLYLISNHSIGVYKTPRVVVGYVCI